MATRFEKNVGSLLGILLGGGIGYLKAKTEGKSKNECWKSALGRGVIGGLTGYAGAELFGTPNDTINYRLFDQEELVYEGIAFDHRVDKRMAEHERSGKRFDSFEFSSSRPREDALRIERNRIKKNRPKYNIQHNR